MNFTDAHDYRMTQSLQRSICLRNQPQTTSTGDLNMKRILIATFSFGVVLGLFALSNKLFSRHNAVRAQAASAQIENHNARPRCSNRTASGTYGYRMRGSIVGLGSFLVNGFFVHNPDGTMRARAYGTINGQTDLIDAMGTFTTNDDCTGTGRFPTPSPLGVITYYFVLTDGGNQIDLINTNPGVALQGTARRIALAGQRPNCDNRMIAGHYSYRLEGSFPGVPNFAGVGYFIHTPTDRENGKVSGFDTNSFSGQIVPRSIQGTYKLNSDCTGSGRYGDSLGNTIDYVFMVVDRGQHIYLQSNYPGGNVAGLATRSQ
jgi:hypothetical protein